MARYYRDIEAADILLFNTTALRWYVHIGWIIALKVDGVLLYPGDYFDEIAELMEDRFSTWPYIPVQNMLKRVADQKHERPEKYLKQWRSAVEGAMRQGPAGGLFLPIAEAREFFGIARSVDFIDLNGELVLPLTANWWERARLAGPSDEDNTLTAAASKASRQPSGLAAGAPNEGATIADAPATEPDTRVLHEEHETADQRIAPSAVRAWAREKGLGIAQRGRISTEIMQQYKISVS